ncbi:hypothetical protein HRR95_003810 [Exophiala dermatitidis]|nr:hypothetical protein HRR95_003810 [Exophiala dermatitidis]
MQTITSSSGGGSSTIVIEMPSKSNPQERRSQELRSTFEDTTAAGALPPPSTSTPQLQKWNSPQINMWRCFSTFYAFIILGANDAAYGALIPYLETWYKVNYTRPLAYIHRILSWWLCSFLPDLEMAWVTVHGVSVKDLTLILTKDKLTRYCRNAWIGDMANANEVLGFLHGFYGLGATISPLLATTLVTKAGWRWYEFYYLMIGAAALEVVILVSAFWKADARAYNAEHPQTADSEISESNSPTTTTFERDGSQQVHTRGILSKLNPLGKVSNGKRKSTSKSKSKTAEAVKNKVTLLGALFLLIYVGAEVSIGGWIVTFMLRVRKGSAFASGLTSTGFWLGITVGRLVLGFVTARVFRSEKHAVAVYLGCSVALQLMFWLIPNFVVSALMVGFLGFFLGPLFPAVVVALTKLLPKKLHVAAVGFAAAFGASGACVLPFAVGAIANAKGVKVLQPIILAALVGCFVVWMMIPKLPKQRMA